VDGNSLLERPEVERAVYRHLGPERSIDDVEEARRSLESRYRDAGYPTVVVNIPEQDVSDGVVTLQVVEGRVDRLRITGSRYFSLGRIRKGVPALAEGEVPYIPEAQNQLEALNRGSADRTVTPLFRPGRTPGTVEVELKVEDELPLHATVELNDRNSQDTSRLRASATVRYANLFQREHSASVQAQTAPQEPDEVKVIAGTYVVPLADSRVLALYGVMSQSDVATAGDINVIGDGTILGARYILPMPSGPGYFHSVTLGADYKDFDESVELGADEGVDTPIDYLRFMAEYRGTLLTERSRARFDAGLGLGVRGLGNTEEEFANKRFQARPNYAYLTAGTELTRELEAGPQLFLNADAQLASGPLVSNEQFSLGGVQSVRGYFESQLLGDDGLQLNAELRSPSFARTLSEELRSARAYVFADGGWIRTQEALPGQPEHEEIYSTGVGVRVEGPQGLSAGFDWAWPLRDAGEVERWDARGHFHIEYEL
jgi:hemolysin activation/secretion protein